MEQKQEQQIEKLDLYRLLQGLFKRLRRLWWLILVLAILGGGLMYLNARRSYRPMYQASTVFSVSVSYGNGTDIMDYANYYDYAAAQLAAETFPYLVRSEAMTQRLKQQLGVEYINGSITASSLGGSTNFFRMSVTSSDPQDAYDILLAVMEIYPLISRQVIGQTQLTVNREPVLPRSPMNSFTWKSDVVLGAAAGAMAGLAVLALLSLFNGTVYKPDELKKDMNLACLASVPNIRRKQRKTGNDTPLLSTHLEADDAFCEAFRLLRLKLLRQMEENKEQVILVTSSLPSEGKSSLAANMALAFANIGKKVLLVDSDLRIQNLKNTLQITQPSTGLVEYLMGSSDKLEPIEVNETGLDLLAGDTPVRNPASLLRHERLRQAIDQLRQRYDYIIIDTPPTLMMADASALAHYADRVVYVVRQDYASRGQIVDGIQTISGTGAKIAGFVFNRADTEGSSYGYGYGYGKRYGYGYGKRYGDADRK